MVGHASPQNSPPESRESIFTSSRALWWLLDGPAGSVGPARTFPSHTHRLPRRSPCLGFEKQDFFAPAGAHSCKSLLVRTSAYTGYSAQTIDFAWKSRISKLRDTLVAHRRFYWLERVGRDISGPYKSIAATLRAA